MRANYKRYIFEDNVAGSGKASSYLKALDMLDEIIKQCSLFGLQDFWSIASVDMIEQLYEYALKYQKEEGSVFLQPGFAPSYGRDRWYSGALRSYKKYLAQHQYEAQLWDIYNKPDVGAGELAQQLGAQDADSVARLIADREIDYSTKEGKEVLRETKARVNQSFFRKMILSTYRSQCCVCGLNVPDVLRASHIVAWSDDKSNRMNPANGLCLSATYDAAFDRHLITFDEKCRMVFSPCLKEFFSNDAFRVQFAAFEGKVLRMPEKFQPEQCFLQKHREKLVS